MAEVGKIYWGVNQIEHTYQSNLQYCERFLYLSGIQTTEAPNLWEQTKNDTTSPWVDQSVNNFTYGTLMSSSNTYTITIQNEIKPICCFRMLGAVEASNRGIASDSYCIPTSYVGLDYIDTSKCVNGSMMFFRISHTLLLSIKTWIEGLNFDSLEKAHNMFGVGGVSSFSGTASDLDLSGWLPQNLTDISYMFAGRKELKTIDISGFNTILVTTMEGVFNNCSNLEEIIGLDYFVTSNVTTFNQMFRQCSKLTTLDLAGFDISSLTNANYMFNDCSKLTTIYANPNADWNSSTILTDSTDMFNNCSLLVGGNGTAYSSSKINKERARIDKSGQVGYFTVATRTLSTSVTGSGTLSGSGTYDYGTEVTVVATPTNGYYTHSFTKDSDSILPNGDTIAPVSYKFNITRNTIFASEFVQRQTRTITVTQEGTNYPIEGAGSYKYLDNPTLIADLNEGLISFLGWYSGEEVLSTQNPYSFTMPDSNLTLVAKFGDTPFSDEKVRQFILRNRNGELYKLTDKNSNIFLNRPTGLGYQKDISAVRYGNTEDIPIEQYRIPQIRGDLYFHNDDIQTAYKDYYDFVRFSVKKPIILWYKIPVLTEGGSEIDNVYHIPVEIVALEKTEYEENGAIISGIDFHGTGFWKHTQSGSTVTASSVSVYNNGDLDSGIEITLQKGDSTSFTNPTITFSDVNGPYGLLALEGTFTKIYLNTKDKEQGLSLWNGSTTELSDPFTYIDFTKADGVKTFPFPRLKNGMNTTITFSYDGIGQESQNFVVIFDKEYVSV